MRKAFAMILVLVLFFTGCTAPKIEPEMPNTESSSTSTNNTTDDKTNDNTVTAPQYDENVPLFGCQDRADIEGDRYVVYYYNHKGDLLKSEENGHIGFYAKNGLAPAYDALTGLIGFVDKSGIFVIEPRWNDAAAFSDDGLALVVLEEETEGGWSKDKYGFINEQGEQVVPCIYDKATSFYPKGVAVVGIAEESEDIYLMNYKYGAVDKRGKTIIEPQYDKIDHIYGNYIICHSKTVVDIYDLSGNILFSENTDIVPGVQLYTFGYSNDVLIRYLWNWNSSDRTFSDLKKIEVFDGKVFKEKNNTSNIRIESRRAATTSTGVAFGVICGEEAVIPFEYDNIIRYNCFYVAIKYNNGNPNEQILDIYNEKFERTAHNLNYNFDNYRTAAFGERILLPSGYFDVYVFDEKVQKYVHGIIDYTGKIIVPLLYYRGIKLITYEGIGGVFE